MLDLNFRLGSTLLLVACTAVACTQKDDDPSETGDPGSSSSDSEGSTSTSTSGTSATSTTGTTGDPVVCEDITVQQECTYGDEQGPYCEWGGPVPVTLDGETCQVGAPIESCFERTGATTAAGCGTNEDGCTTDLFFKRDGDQILILQECGGSSIVGFEPCTFIEPFVYDPPECGCVCPGTGETTGSTGEGSTGDGSTSGG